MALLSRLFDGRIGRFLNANGVYKPRLKGSYEADDISGYYRSPVEMGWARNVKFDHDFIGRKALEAEVENPKRSIISLEFNAEDVLDIMASLFQPGEVYEPIELPHPEMWSARNDKVLKDGQLIGVSTVPGYSYYFRKIISHRDGTQGARIDVFTLRRRADDRTARCIAGVRAEAVLASAFPPRSGQSLAARADAQDVSYDPGSFRSSLTVKEVSFTRDSGTRRGEDNMRHRLRQDAHQAFAIPS